VSAIAQSLVAHPAGFEFIPGVFQYSGGVRAASGHTIERYRFSRNLPLAEGFARIEALLAERNAPKAAFCACELRSPAPFTDEGFRDFNLHYAGVLKSWNMIDANGRNPVARSNLCPVHHPPAEPGFFAFSICLPAAEAGGGFVVSGSGEVPEGRASYRDHIIRKGDVSEAGLFEKTCFVLGEMERRLSLLGADWSATTGVQVYTEHALTPAMLAEMAKRGAAHAGLHWHLDRPPVVDIEFEMDCRRIATERLLHV
jgi:hypothetical protein